VASKSGRVGKGFGFWGLVITRFRDCKSVEDYLPKAGELHRQENENYVPWENIPCDSRMARILGRDGSFVAVVRLKALRPTDGNWVSADYESVKVLKGKEATLRNIQHHPKELGEVVETNKPDSSDPVHKLGPEGILFLSSDLAGHPQPMLHCPLIRPTPENLNAVLEGIADDRSNVLDSDWN
jgi:hypothetical protein